jgi:DNA-binding XRE family transcriptional regulator
MAKTNELKLIRTSLKLNQGEMGRALGINTQSYYSTLENEPQRPAAQELLQKAKSLYEERMGQPWQLASERLAVFSDRLDESIRERETPAADAAAEAFLMVEETPELRALPMEKKARAVGVITQLLSLEKARGQAGYVRENLKELLGLAAQGAIQFPDK